MLSASSAYPLSILPWLWIWGLNFISCSFSLTSAGICPKRHKEKEQGLKENVVIIIAQSIPIPCYPSWLPVLRGGPPHCPCFHFPLPFVALALLLAYPRTPSKLTSTTMDDSWYYVIMCGFLFTLPTLRGQSFSCILAHAFPSAICFLPTRRLNSDV